MSSDKIETTQSRTEAPDELELRVAALEKRVEIIERKVKSDAVPR